MNRQNCPKSEEHLNQKWLRYPGTYPFESVEDVLWNEIAMGNANRNSCDSILYQDLNSATPTRTQGPESDLHESATEHPSGIAEKAEFE